MMKSKINLRNSTLFLISIMILLALTGGASAIGRIGSPYLNLVIDQISPEPVEPGQEVTAKVRLVNEGGATANDVSLELNSEYPFYVKTKNNNLESKRQICVGCSFESTYYIVVDANATSGVYPLSFNIHMGDVTMKPADNLSIKIIGKPDIVIKSKLPKNPLEPNDQFDYSIELENIGTGKARNIKISSSSSTFILLGSGIVTLDTIAARSKKAVTLPFQISESLKPDTYTVPITLKFLDEQNNEYNASQNLGFKVIHRADLAIQSLKIDPPKPASGEDVEIKMRIQNAGYGNAENVKVELNSELEGNKKTFLGKIDSGDDSLAIFTLAAPESEEAKVTVTISYKDDMGSSEIVDNFSIPVELAGGIPGYAVTIIVVLLGLLIYFGYRRLRKKRAK